MQFATQLARARAWSRDALDAVMELGELLLREVRLAVDVPRLRSAKTWSDRLQALSWPRVAALSGAVAVLIAGSFGIYALTRPDVSQQPTARELELRQYALENVSHVPPAGLVEANKSWKAE